jgi:hypothetical protein
MAARPPHQGPSAELLIVATTLSSRPRSCCHWHRRARGGVGQGGRSRQRGRHGKESSSLSPSSTVPPAPTVAGPMPAGMEGRHPYRSTSTRFGRRGGFELLLQSRGALDAGVRDVRSGGGDGLRCNSAGMGRREAGGDAHDGGGGSATAT